MCGYNQNSMFVKLIYKAIMDETFRKQFLADPAGTAQTFGFSEADQNEMARYSARKLAALVEGPRSHC
ncbi:MAG: hypothetical protein ACP5IL_01865 [Syntrophobacteraceae bacterium]